jgi:hypothetical protein
MLQYKIYYILLYCVLYCICMSVNCTLLFWLWKSLTYNCTTIALLRFRVSDVGYISLVVRGDCICMLLDFMLSSRLLFTFSTLIHYPSLYGLFLTVSHSNFQFSVRNWEYVDWTEQAFYVLDEYSCCHSFMNLLLSLQTIPSVWK